MTEGGHPRRDLLVDPRWVWRRRDDPLVRVVDCSEAGAYRRAHLPGAVGLGTLAHPWIKGGGLNADGVGRRVPSTLPVPTFTTGEGDEWMHVTPAEEFAELMQRLGISDDTVVVAYDDAGGPYAARLWWVLAYYGHRHAKILDGGWQRWVGEGRPVSVDVPEPRSVRFTATPDASLLWRREDLRDRLGDPNLRVIDTRTRGEWTGRHDEFGNRRTGRVPGAVHLEWLEFLNGGWRFRSPAEMKALIEERGVRPEDEVVTYCQAAIRAAHVAFVLTLLGWDRVRVYDASMFEWANRDDTPLVEGAG